MGCYLAATRVMKRPWLAALTGGFILAAIPSFVMWSFSGLENPLYALVVTHLAVLVFRAFMDGRLLTRRIAVAAGLLAAVAALTRPDGLVYAGVYPLAVPVTLIRSQPRRGTIHAVMSVAAFAVPVGAYFLWRHATFGLWVPNTAVAKG